MRRAVLATIAATMLATVPGAGPATAAPQDRYEVYGVKGEDMLKCALVRASVIS